MRQRCVVPRAIIRKQGAFAIVAQPKPVDIGMEILVEVVVAGHLVPLAKKPVTLRLDADVVAWFKEHAQDCGYQTEINRVLRRYVSDAQA